MSIQSRRIRKLSRKNWLANRQNNQSYSEWLYTNTETTIPSLDEFKTHRLNLKSKKFPPHPKEQL